MIPQPPYFPISKTYDDLGLVGYFRSPFQNFHASESSILILYVIFLMVLRLSIFPLIYVSGDQSPLLVQVLIGYERILTGSHLTVERSDTSISEEDSCDHPEKQVIISFINFWKEVIETKRQTIFDSK